jgi:hypothetical protein
MFWLRKGLNKGEMEKRMVIILRPCCDIWFEESDEGRHTLNAQYRV